METILARHLHGDPLSPGERAELDRHLSGCAPCRASRDDLSSLHEALLRLPGGRVEPPPELAGRIMANLPPYSLAAARLRRASVVAGAVAAGVLLTLAVQRVLPGKGVVPGAVPPAGPPASVPAQVAAVPPSDPEPAAREAAPSRPVREERRLASSTPAVTVVREVKIFLFHPEAKQVAVTGDFNDWDPEGVLLHPGGRPGLWEGELRLGPGAYSYNFIVDGDVLVPDPASAGQSPDGYGGTNSILLVKGASPS